jgi:predicted nucleic acid-binding protein
MRTYADSSFILRLVTGESDSPQVIAEYRRLRAPKLFFLPLHALEVRNAILQRAFHQRRSVASSGQGQIARERDAALSRLERLLARQALLEVALDPDAAIQRAAELSIAHTERIGARAIDLLHVAGALTLKSEQFLTTDNRQAQLARAAGMKVVIVN